MIVADIIDPTLPPLAPDPQGLTGSGWVIYFTILTVLIVANVANYWVAWRRRDDDGSN